MTNDETCPLPFLFHFSQRGEENQLSGDDGRDVRVIIKTANRREIFPLIARTVYATSVWVIRHRRMFYRS